jgi:hypothetical protein
MAVHNIPKLNHKSRSSPVQIGNAFIEFPQGDPVITVVVGVLVCIVDVGQDSKNKRLFTLVLSMRRAAGANEQE